MFCPLCQSNNDADATRCGACGTPLGARSVSANPNSAFPDALSIGTVLGGTFVVEGVLGQGGFGITYRCHDQMLDRRVAVKEFFPFGCRRHQALVQPSRGVTPADFVEARAQFLTEARMLARCRHAGIVAVYAAFEANETAYMVMELLHGQSAAQRLQARGTHLDEAEAVSLVERIGEALHFVHDLGLLHRDIKPENIMVCDDGRAMLIDFGTAREYVTGQSQGHTIVVTPGYAPLEQYARQAKRGAFTDIYGLAATLYHLLTGLMPPAASDRAMGVALRPVREENPQISASVASAVEAALQMEIAKRPQNVREFLGLLRGEAFVDEAAAGVSSTNGLGSTKRFSSINTDFIDEELDALGVPSQSDASSTKRSPAPAMFPPVKLQPRDESRNGPLKPFSPQVQTLATPAKVVTSSALPASSTNSGGGISTHHTPAWDLAVPFRWGMGIMLLLFVMSFGFSLTEKSSNSNAPNYRSSPGSVPAYLQRGFSSRNPSGFPSTARGFPNDARQIARDAARREWDSLPSIAPASVVSLPLSAQISARDGSKTPYFSLSRSARFSPDGGLLAYADSNAIVRIWSMTQKRVLRSLPQLKTHALSDIDFSRDGQTLALTFDGQNADAEMERVRVWNLRTGKLQGTLSLNPAQGWVSVEAVRADGQLLLIRGTRWTQQNSRPPRSLQWWNPRTAKNSPTSIVSGANLNEVVLSADEKEFITGDRTGQIRWIDARTGSTKAERGTRLTYRDLQASLPPHSPLTGMTDLKAPLQVTKLSLSNNDSVVAVSNKLQTRVFDSKAQEIGDLPTHGSLSSTVSPDGNFVAQQSWDNGPINPPLLWNVRRGQKTKLLKPSMNYNSVKALSFSPDGKQVMGVESSDGRVSLLTWNVNDPVVPQFANPQTSTFGSSRDSVSAFSSTKQLLATPGANGIEIRQPNGTLIKTLDSAPFMLGERTFSPDGQRLASRSSKGEVQILNVQNGQKTATLKALSPVRFRVMDIRGKSKSMAFSSNNRLFARVGAVDVPISTETTDAKASQAKVPDIEQKPVIEVWNLEKTPRRLALLNASARVTALAFSPDGRSLVYGDAQGVLWSVDATTGKFQAQIKNGSNPIAEIVFMRQGLLVADVEIAGSTITRYDTRSKRSSRGGKARGFEKKSQIFLRSGRQFNKLAISPEGKYFAMGSDTYLYGNNVKIWDLSTGVFLQLLRVDSLDIEALAFSPDSTQIVCIGQRFRSSEKQITIWRRPRSTVRK